MKKNFRFVFASMLLIAGIVYSCKKDEDTVVLDEETRQFNDDSNTFKSESDQADNDINSTLQDIPTFGRVAGVQAIPVCGLSIDSSQIAQKIIYLNFDSTISCLVPARRRSGQIKVQLTTGNYWRDSGSQLTLTYINFKIQRVSTGRSITVNGIKTLTNINGNNWLGFLGGNDTLKYRSRATQLAVQFSSGLSATWNATHTTSWWYLPATQVVYFTANGDTTMNSYNHVASWGVNRYGKNFITYYEQPVISNSSCGFGRPVSGAITHNVNNSQFFIDLGMDQNGNHTVSGCSYGYLVTWIYNDNKVGQGVFAY